MENTSNRSRLIAINGRVIVETYKEDRALKSKVQNGFATIEQKSQLVGLKALADGLLTAAQGESQYVAKGDVVYIREALLRDAAWAKVSFTADLIEGNFMIVESQYVEFVAQK
jgi:hypothetical protein